MATREKIREGVLDRLVQADPRICMRTFDHVLSSGEKKELYEEEMLVIEELGIVTNNLLNYLHSQGLVLRVKCPDCEWSQFGEEHVGMTPCYSCNSTGYIIEPLIEEVKDD